MPGVRVRTPKGVLLVPLPSVCGWSASLRFFFGGLGFAPKEEKPIAVAMSSGEEGEGERGREEGILGVPIWEY